MQFETWRKVIVEVVDWLTFFNYKRLYSTLNYISLMQLEQNRLAAQSNKAA